jgi:hypothetical protein
LNEQTAVLENKKKLKDKTSELNEGGTEEPKGPIEEFYAVTETSAYQVSSEKDSDNTPIVEKIDMVGKSMVSIGDRLHGGSLVGIMKDGLVLYLEDYKWFSKHERPQRPEDVSIAFWGGRTSPIVALCLKKDDALTCLHSKGLKRCDPSWRKETEEVLQKISDDHPVFILSVTDAIKFD